jgi:hypothetical protein
MGATLVTIGTKRRPIMVRSTCETIKLSSKPSGFGVELVSVEQSIKATSAAMVATYHWALRRKAAKANGKISADGYVVEVWHV